MYEVTPYILNNLGAVLAELLLITMFAVLLNKVNVDTDFIMNHELLSTIILSLQKMFVWNFIFVILLSNFQKLCVFTFVSLYWPSIYSSVGIVNFTFSIITTIVVTGVFIYVFRNIKKIRDLLTGNMRDGTRKVTNLSVTNDKTSSDETARNLKKDDSQSSSMFGTPAKATSIEYGLSPMIKKPNVSFVADSGAQSDIGSRVTQVNSPLLENNEGKS